MTAFDWRWSDPYFKHRHRWWMEFSFQFNPRFKGLVWFHRYDRGARQFWCQQTLGLDGVHEYPTMEGRRETLGLDGVQEWEA